MELRFDDRVVLVTGGGSGIGAGLARGFGAAGAKVIVHYHRSRDGAERVADEIDEAGGSASAHGADLTDRGEVRRLFDSVLAESGEVDVLINNAGGLVERCPIASTSDELYDRSMELNFGSVFSACRAVVPGMRARGGGTIINVTSIAARTGGGPGSSLYCAGKGAVSSFTRALAKELAPDGIRVNAISPGIIDTAFHDKTPRDAYESMVSAIPLGRAGKPDEVLGAALFLASETHSSFVTGAILEVNGGQVMG